MEHQVSIAQAHATKICRLCMSDAIKNCANSVEEQDYWNCGICGVCLTKDYKKPRPGPQRIDYEPISPDDPNLLSQGSA